MRSIQLWLVDTTSAEVHEAASTDYLARASLNTGYAIHPEETLADNFSLLVARRRGKSEKIAKPEVVDAIEKALTRQ